MKYDEKVNYLRIALGLAGIQANNKACDLVLQINDGLNKKKGKFSLDDQVKIEQAIEEKYKPKEKKEK